MSRRQTATEQLTAVVDHQVQFETVTPATRAASAHRQSRKDFVLINPAVVADGDESRVDETDARAAPKQAEQVRVKPSKDKRHKLDEASIAH